MPTASKTSYLSVRAYAEHRKAKGLSGQSHTAVRRAIGSERLQKSVRRDGRKVLIDRKIADEEWKRNTRPERSRAPGSGRETQKRKPGRPKTEKPKSEGELFPDPGPATDPAQQAATARQAEAYFEKTQAEAELKRLQLQERRGELISRVQADRDGYEIARSLQKALLGIPDRLAGQLGRNRKEQHAARELMLGELHSVLTSFVRAQEKSSAARSA